MTDGAATALEPLQRWMQAVLVNPLGGAEQAPHLHLGPDAQAGTVDALIRSSSRLSAHEHLAIYQRSYLVRLRECMAAQFPALAHALGDDLFRHFADQYLQRYPSDSYTLAELGSRFATFLDKTRPDREAAQRESWPDFLIEMAEFEYAITVLFDAEESTPESDERADDIRVAPIVQLFEHAFPIAGYYRAATAGDEPQLPFPEPTWSVVVRRNFRLGVFDLQPAQYQLLTALQSGCSLADARAAVVDGGYAEPSALDAIWPVWERRWRELGVLAPLA